MKVPNGKKIHATSNDYTYKKNRLSLGKTSGCQILNSLFLYSLVFRLFLVFFYNFSTDLRILLLYCNTDGNYEMLLLRFCIYESPQL